MLLREVGEEVWGTLACGSSGGFTEGIIQGLGIGFGHRENRAGFEQYRYAMLVSRQLQINGKSGIGNVVQSILNNRNALLG